MAANGNQSTPAADGAEAEHVAVVPPAAPLSTEGSASVANNERVATPPTTGTGTTVGASSHGDAIGNATAGSTASQAEAWLSGAAASEAPSEAAAEGERNVRPRLTNVQPLAVAVAVPALPAARVSTMWQVSTGDGWWQDCSAPFASALEAQFQEGVGVARFAFFGNTRVGRIDYTHDLVQCQQFNHHSSQYKQIRRLTVTLGS